LFSITSDHPHFDIPQTSPNFAELRRIRSLDNVDVSREAAPILSVMNVKGSDSASNSDMSRTLLGILKRWRRGFDEVEEPVSSGLPLGHSVSKSVDTLSSFHIRASSNRASSFFSTAAYASLPSKSRNGGFRSRVNWTIA
jgi:hypothetical protein